MWGGLAVLILVLFTGCSSPGRGTDNVAAGTVKVEESTLSAGSSNKDVQSTQNTSVQDTKPEEIPPEDDSQEAVVPQKAPKCEGISRGVNLGNALEAPQEGAWGVVLKESYFEKIKDAGFDFVRIPVRWSGHASLEAPYEIDANFLKRVDWAVEQALSRGLVAILDMHGYDEFMQDPKGEEKRFIGLWKQLSKHYAGYPDKLYFELLNEPTNNVPGDVWNNCISGALKIIRTTNPDRYIVVGPVSWNGIQQLYSLSLPEKDKKILVTYHYYSPMEFTHQGAEWVQGSDSWMGTAWTGTAAEKAAVRSDFDLAVEWARSNNRPLLMGEFGAYSTAKMVYRTRWTGFAAREAEKRGIAWSYWEFCAGFGVYDSGAGEYRQELIDALIPPGK